MTTRFCAALLLAALAIALFTGCSVNAAQLDRAKDFAQNRLERSEDALESRVQAVAPTSSPVPAASAALLTKEDAEKIALEHAGFTADQVTRLRTELDYERGKPEYEVDFRVDRYEYDYEIDAQTGKILSWDKDLDD